MRAPQVVLYEAPSVTGLASATLSMEQCLQPGMSFTAYYSEDHDSGALHDCVKVAVHTLMQDSSAVLVEAASHCSTIIYITVVRTSGVSVERLVEALQRNGKTEDVKVNVQWGPQSFFELNEKGMFQHFSSNCATTCC